MPAFHQLEVLEVKRETEEAVSILLKIPKELEEEFDFIPGQYVMFRREIDGETVKRAYSISSSPQEGELRVGVKEVIGGKFSTFVNRALKAGDLLETLPPRGKFIVNTNPENAHKYVSFCAGSGVTPILSMMKHVLETEPQSTFMLFYGNRTASTIIYLDEINALRARFPQRLVVHYVMSKEELGEEMFQGRIDEEKIRLYSSKLFNPAEVDHYYMCGPEQIIHVVNKVLADLGVPADKIHFELFGSPNPVAKDQKKAAEAKVMVLESSHVSITLNGSGFEFKMENVKTSILEAADEQGYDVPFSCRNGVCCTCIARLKEGEVEMEKSTSLTDKELADGLILACQSRPKTKTIVLDFDDV
ncbi:2Fe-2S iron-sulfur cluster-binding protein [Bacteroidota bacterium]